MTAKSVTEINGNVEIGKIKLYVDGLNKVCNVQHHFEIERREAYEGVIDAWMKVLRLQDKYVLHQDTLVLQLNKNLKPLFENLEPVAEVVEEVYSNESEADEQQQLRSISQTSTNRLFDPSVSQSRESMDEDLKIENVRAWFAGTLSVNPDCNAPSTDSVHNKAKRCWKEENSCEEGIEEKKTVVLTPTVKKIKVKERCNQNEVMQEHPEDDDIKDNKENVKCKDYDDDLITERNEDNNNNNNNNNNNEDQQKEEGYSNKAEKEKVKEKGGAAAIKQTLSDMFDTVIEVVKEALIVTSGHIAKLFKFKHRTSKSDKIPVQQDVKVEDPVDSIEPHTRKQKASISTVSISTVPAKKSKGASISHGPDRKKSHSR